MKKCLIYTILSAVTILSLMSSAYLYVEYMGNCNTIDYISKQNDLMSKQIDARNGVIDKLTGTNLANPLSLSENYEQVKKKYATVQKSKFKNILSDNACREIIVPLYTPDGHYFGEISYGAYGAIVCDELDEYKSVDDKEMQILHSYMNYITLNPGMSLVKHW